MKFFMLLFAVVAAAFVNVVVSSDIAFDAKWKYWGDIWRDTVMLKPVENYTTNHLIANAALVHLTMQNKPMENIYFFHTNEEYINAASKLKGVVAFKISEEKDEAKTMLTDIVASMSATLSDTLFCMEWESVLESIVDVSSMSENIGLSKLLKNDQLHNSLAIMTSNQCSEENRSHVFQNFNNLTNVIIDASEKTFGRQIVRTILESLAQHGYSPDELNQWYDNYCFPVVDSDKFTQNVFSIAIRFAQSCMIGDSMISFDELYNRRKIEYLLDDRFVIFFSYLIPTIQNGKDMHFTLVSVANNLKEFLGYRLKNIYEVDLIPNNTGEEYCISIFPLNMPSTNSYEMDAVEKFYNSIDCGIEKVHHSGRFLIKMKSFLEAMNVMTLAINIFRN